jgi:hypothetical protein
MHKNVIFDTYFACFKMKVAVNAIKFSGMKHFPSIIVFQFYQQRAIMYMEHDPD